MTILESIDIAGTGEFCGWAKDHNMCSCATTGCSNCKISQAKLKALSTLCAQQAANSAAENKSPCDLCRYDPTSSCDGKPCTICPAEPKEAPK